MINSYCNSLDETFAQWVYFGIIKAEDAQCFSVQSSIEEGSFILAVGAVLLAFLNAFVNKAATQYFRDMEKSIPLVAGVHKSGDLAATDMVVVEESIRPVPVLFTDTFRWFLRGVESGFSSDSSDLETSFHKYTTRTSGIDNEPNMHTMSDSTNSEGPGEMQTCWVMDHDDASESGDNSSLQGSKSQISMET